MKYGPYNDNVLKIINVVDEARILSGMLNHDVENECILVSDWVEAVELMREQSFDESTLSWLDLRQQEMAKVRGSAYTTANGPSIRNEISGLVDYIPKKLKQSLPKPYMNAIDDVSSDLFNCAFNEAFGRPSILFTKMANVYLAGGAPCSWQGEFPVGKIKAFFPR